MFILDIDKKRTYMAKTAFCYLLFSAFVLVFGQIYEYFSFGVWSAAMVYAMAVPLILGAMPALYLAISKKCRRMPGRIPLILYQAGIITLTVGCIVKGVLVIYGTTNRLTNIYLIAGMALIGAAAVSFAAALRRA